MFVWGIGVRWMIIYSRSKRCDKKLKYLQINVFGQAGHSAKNSNLALMVEVFFLEVILQPFVQGSVIRTPCTQCMDRGMDSWNICVDYILFNHHLGIGFSTHFHTDCYLHIWESYPHEIFTRNLCFHEKLMPKLPSSPQAFLGFWPRKAANSEEINLWPDERGKRSVSG